MLVADGLLPASVVAWKACAQCYYADQSWGNALFGRLFLLSFVFAFIPALSRVALGRSSFGDDGVEKAILALSFLGAGSGFQLMLAYTVLPSFDYYNRLAAAQFCCDLMDQGVAISPPPAETTEDEPDAASTVPKAHAGTEDESGERDRQQSRRYAPSTEAPRLILDMRKSANVLAWSLVRRSVTSGDFALSFCECSNGMLGCGCCRDF